MSQTPRTDNAIRYCSMLNRNMPPGFGERVCSDGLQALIKNGKDLEIELAEFKTKLAESEALHDTIKSNLSEADYRVACGEIVTYGELPDKTPRTDQLMRELENGSVDLMRAVELVKQLEAELFEANKNYQTSIGQQAAVVRGWRGRCSDLELLVEKLQSCENCNHGVANGYEPGCYCKIDREMLCRIRSNNPLHQSYWQDELDDKVVEQKPAKIESQTPLCEAWLEDGKSTINDLVKLAIRLETLKSDAEEIIHDLVNERDCAINDIQIMTGKLKTEREYSKACEDRAEKLEKVIYNTLLSADAEWEAKDMGHDWRQACLNMRNALLSKKPEKREIQP